MIIGRGGPNDRAPIQLATRTNKFIPNETRQEAPPAQLRASVELWEKEIPQARLRTITAVYNCMGLVFAARRTHVDIEQMRMILSEDGYHQLADESDTDVGDIVVYGTADGPSHIGVIVTIKINLATATRELIIMSKWGRDGEYIHPLNQIPTILGQPLEYWTDRR